MKVEVLSILAMTMTAVAGHKYEFGSCKRANVMEDFDMGRFLGKWYVVGGFGTSSTCLEFTYSQNSDGDYEVKESKELNLPEMVGLDYKYSVVGTLKPASDSPAKFRVTFPTNPLKADYQVLGTDYDNYAAIYHCQSFGGVFRRKNVYALTKNLADAMVAFNKTKLRMEAADAGLSSDSFKLISHEDCVTPEDADIHTNFDGELFDLSPDDIASAVGKVKDAVETFT